MSKRITTSSEEEYQKEIAKQAMEIKLRNNDIPVRKINLKKFHSKLSNYESGEFILGKLLTKPEEDIGLTGSHEEQDGL